MELRLLRAKVTLTLVSILFVLVVAHTIGWAYQSRRPDQDANGLVRLFNLGEEANLPSFYSALILLISAILLAVIAVHARSRKLKYAFHWGLLSLIFAYLSIDEACAVHEISIGTLRGGLKTSGIFYFAWVIPAGILVMLVGLTYLKFVWALPRGVREQVIVAGSLYVGGALGMEMVGGYLMSHYGGGQLGSLASTVEETMEMAGVVMFIHALLRYIQISIGTVSVQVTSGDSSVPKVASADPAKVFQT